MSVDVFAGVEVSYPEWLVVATISHGGREYVSEGLARAVFHGAGFGFRREVKADGTLQFVTTCREQRGDDGAYRLHALLCDAGVPCHIE